MDTKEVFSTRVQSTVIKSLRHLAVDLRRSIGSLLEEAIQDLLKKYSKPSQNRKTSSK